MTLLNAVHFTRPELLFLIPLVLLIAMLFDTQQITHQLKDLVAPHLLKHLTNKSQSHSLNKWLGVVCISLLCIGLSGVSFSKTDTPLYASSHKTVFVVDQSLSMYATDVRPNRLTKAKQILRDVLDNDLEGEFALIAFAGDAYVISPFTQDKETLTHFLVALDPVIMPLYGSQLHKGIELAFSLLDSNDSGANIIAITDDMNAIDESYFSSSPDFNSVKLDIISIGTEAGAHIVLPNGETLRRNNVPILATTPTSLIKKITEQVNGKFYTQGASKSDIKKIGQPLNVDLTNAKNSGVSGETWHEQGHWFALPFLIWLLWQFKNTALLCLILTITLTPDVSRASPLDWFKTADQQAQDAVNQGDWAIAKELFENPSWQAASLYATENYKNSAMLLSKIAKTAEEFYNLGNALALSNDLDGAIAAYSNAINQRPDFKEAKENLEYLNQLKQEQEQEQESKSDHDSEDDSQQNQEQSSQTDSENGNAPSQTQDNDPLNQDNQTDSSSDLNASASEPAAAQETQQALDQWLRQIQDDPGTLLQRKLWYLHQERRNENRFNEEEGMQPW